MMVLEIVLHVMGRVIIRLMMVLAIVLLEIMRLLMVRVIALLEIVRLMMVLEIVRLMMVLEIVRLMKAHVIVLPVMDLMLPEGMGGVEDSDEALLLREAMMVMAEGAGAAVSMDRRLVEVVACSPFPQAQRRMQEACHVLFGCYWDAMCHCAVLRENDNLMS